MLEQILRINRKNDTLEQKKKRVIINIDIDRILNQSLSKFQVLLISLKWRLGLDSCTSREFLLWAIY